MFRITTHGVDGELVLKLEGYLTGDWVQELAICWDQIVSTAPGALIKVDLTGLWRVDAGGREMLEALHRAGARLVAKGCVMPVLIREIAESAQNDRWFGDRGGEDLSRRSA